MLLKYSRTIVTLATSLLVLAASQTAQAHGWQFKHCDPSCEVFHSPFFGYYPTCWRGWPGGQPECPRAVLLPAQPIGPVPQTELLQPPKPEKNSPKE